MKKTLGVVLALMAAGVSAVETENSKLVGQWQCVQNVAESNIIMVTNFIDTYYSDGRYVTQGTLDIALTEPKGTMQFSVNEAGLWGVTNNGFFRTTGEVTVNNLSQPEANSMFDYSSMFPLGKKNHSTITNLSDTSLVSRDADNVVNNCTRR